MRTLGLQPRSLSRLSLEQRQLSGRVTQSWAFLSEPNSGGEFAHAGCFPSRDSAGPAARCPFGHQIRHNLLGSQQHELTRVSERLTVYGQDADQHHAEIQPTPITLARRRQATFQHGHVTLVFCLTRIFGPSLETPTLYSSIRLWAWSSHYHAAFRKVTGYFRAAVHVTMKARIHTYGL